LHSFSDYLSGFREQLHDWRTHHSLLRRVSASESAVAREKRSERMSEQATLAKEQKRERDRDKCTALTKRRRRTITPSYLVVLWHCAFFLWMGGNSFDRENVKNPPSEERASSQIYLPQVHFKRTLEDNRDNRVRRHLTTQQRRQPNEILLKG